MPRNADDDRRRSGGVPGGASGAGPHFGAASMTIGDPLGLIEREHGLQLIFCDRLEEIADRLPENTAPNLVGSALHLLGGGLKPHTRLEEEALFPLLRKRGPYDKALVEACRQLEKEHAQDASQALEIVDELRGLQVLGTAANPDMLGYMLRGFFSGQRRHIDWENAVIIPAARRLLVADDLAELSTWMLDNNHQSFTDLLQLVVSSPAAQFGSS